MKSILCFLLALVIFSSTGFSQELVEELSKSEKRHYQKVSTRSRYVPSGVTTSVPNLATYLGREASTDLERIRAIYVWVANNIRYDMRAFRNDVYPAQDAHRVLASRTAVCQGYSNLVSALGKEMGIKTFVISGYSKGYGYQKGQEFEVTDHAWNAVKLDGKWYLLDATWAATKTNLPLEYDLPPQGDRYFLAEPGTFVIDHLPADPYWQLLTNPVPIEVFERNSTAITDYVNEGPGSFNYLDSLARWETDDSGSQEILHYTRATSFNPKNKKAKYQLGEAYFFKALDSLELINEFMLPGIYDDLSHLEDRIFLLLEEAAFHFGGIMPGDVTYDYARNYLEEVTYQKGIFKYEAGQRLMRILIGMDDKSRKSHYPKFKSVINRYYDEATEYFALVATDSRYYDDAQEYINRYIKDYRP